VVDDRRTHRVTAFTVGLVYHVEPHPYAARVPGP
jgi:hypothetical protein